MESFQVDNGAPVTIPMMQQDNYSVKMGADSDLSCTVSGSCSTIGLPLTPSPHSLVSLFALLFTRSLRSRWTATSACSSSCLTP